MPTAMAVLLSAILSMSSFVPRASSVATTLPTAVCTYTPADQCSDAALQPAINTLAETYGPSSRCVEAAGLWVRTVADGTRSFSDPLGQTGCYEYFCSSDTGVTINVLGQSFTCSKKGEVLVVDITESGVRYQGRLTCPSCLEICFDETSNCPETTSVQLDFEKEVYSVSESVGSEDLSLYVCLTADKVDRPFTVTLTPVPGTAIADEDYTDTCKDIEFDVGVEVLGCGCVGIVSDTIPEPTETFEIRATVNDENILLTGQTTAQVQINEST